MRILFVDLEFDYGIESRGKNIIGHDGFKYSFEKLGHEVIPFYYDQYLPDTKPLQSALLKFADKIKPDLIFFCLFKDQFEHATLLELKSKYVTLNWFGDDQWRFDTFTKHYANDFTWCVTTDLYSVDKYVDIGQNQVVMSQWAAIDSHNNKPQEIQYKHDVSFVGGFHPYRAWFINQLVKNGISVEVFGHGWPNGSLSPESMNQLFRESKINLNISNSNSFDIRYLTSSIKALILAIRSKKSNSQIKARNFEIPFFGGFQISDYVPSLEAYFDIGNEVACYSTPEEAALQINYYLKNEELREKVRLSGQQRATNTHGYIHRFEKILEQIK
ncbi:CgeB family protein [Thiomicrorhabdus arctica]|uniref:CgeB family protein n=1 Tax=Thiomicrorhabdus arctica TaxID=131540 RepID=UPI000366FF84|nr:glycosyltransferase [Thiomicrorhabdus arctica]